MSRRIFYTREIPFPLEQVWPLLDFPSPGWTVRGGGGREIGSTRSMEIPNFGLVVDELLAYRSEPHRKAFTYAQLNEDNAMGAQGYEGTITVLRNTTDPSRCFLLYEARWDDAEQPVGELFPSLMNGMIDQLIDGLTAAN